MASKNWFKVGLTSLAVAGSLCLPHQINPEGVHIPRQKPAVVGVGDVGYARGSMVSYDFVRCSAVIFDYGDSAFMAHALPLPEWYWRERSITSGSVVDYLVQKSTGQGFNPKEATVFVNAGDQVSLDRIIERLAANGIVPREARLRFRRGYDPGPDDERTIVYDPARNKLAVYRPSEFPDFRDPIDPLSWEGP